MKTDSQTPASKQSKPQPQTAPFEPILDEKLSRFLTRMDSELAQPARLDAAE